MNLYIKNLIIIMVFRYRKFDNHLKGFILKKRRYGMKKLIISILIILAMVLFVRFSVFADPSDDGGSVLSVTPITTELPK